jgi:SH3-like domain-containing protein
MMAMLLWGAVAMAERLAVSIPRANIRSGPGTTYNILWNAEKYYPVFVFEKKGSWYHFRDFEGDEGWIHKSIVQNIPSIITTKPRCNVRSGPGTQHEIVFTVEDGVPFKVLTRQGNWIHVEHRDGDKGWIHKSLTW